MDLSLQKFFILLPVALAVYYLTKRRAQNYWLLILSYGLYATWTWYFPLVLLFLTLVNFVIGQELQNYPKERGGRRILLWVGIICNLGMLGFLKYSGFFTNLVPGAFFAIEHVLNIENTLVNILLPIGLSFTVLETISYLVDIYQGRVKAETDLIDFALYLAYFPKLLAGPIERARSFLPQLKQDRMVDNQAVSRSGTLIIVGLLRKIVIADSLFALIPAEAFDDPSQFTGPQLIIWLLAYAFALYNDFAGYTSMMRGISELFGIKLSKNFQQPYFARNFTEFWNRWHMSLSFWLRDYIYFPISRWMRQYIKNPKQAANLIIPPLVTMLVSAMWHGLSPMILVWGLLHGIYQIIWRMPTLWSPTPPPDKQPWWRQTLSRIAVFILVVLAWIPFRTFASATIDYWQGLFNFSLPIVVDLRVIVLIIPAFLMDWLQHRKQDELIFLQWPRLAQAAALSFAFIILFLTLQASQKISAEFVYQGF